MGLSFGNKKLGKSLIHSFSLPVGKKKTCIGAYECEEVCYGKDGFYLFSRKLQASLQKNFELSLREEFPEWMLMELLRHQTKVMRIHTVGDFYHPLYAYKWLKVIKKLPSVFFFMYSRSWVDPSIRELLEKLSEHRNTQVWWSWDRSMPELPKIPKKVRVAYLSLEENDVPKDKVDLLFRVKPMRSSIQKKVGETLVCPEENGITKTSCDKCSICWLPSNMHVRDKSRIRYSLQMV